MQRISILIFCLLLVNGVVSAEEPTIQVGQFPAAVWKTNFYGLKDKEYIENYYNGGKGSLGSGPGPNDGITYSSNAQVLHSVLRGGSGNFAGDPGNLPVMFLNSAGGTYLNVPAGFATGIAFHYSAAYLSGSVAIWSGLNGTGAILATQLLASNGACTNGPAFCNWTAVGVAFTGTAKSVTFNGTVNQIGFASVKVGSDKP